MIRRLLRRRGTVPVEPAVVAALEKGERVLATAALARGGTAVATQRALLLARGEAEVQRLPWWQVLAASWDHETWGMSLETLESGDGSAGTGSSTLRLHLQGNSPLPETVRERVQDSIVVSQHVPVAGRLGVRLVARRVPGRDDLLWQRVGDPGVDLSDPLVRERVRSALAHLRAQTTA